MSPPEGFSAIGSPGKSGRPQSSDDAKENMWSGLLDSVASGKRLPEKNVILLGGSKELQRDFLEALDSENSRRPQERFRKKPPVANEFALGYTYQDVLDADQEDILARLSIHTLQQPSLSFAPLLKPLLTPESIPETLLVVLLDWAEPWNWVRQLRDWIGLLHEVLSTLGEDSKKTMQEIMQEWEQRRRGGAHDGSGTANTTNEANVTIPLGPGEWDEGLGLPLCVVCHNSNKIDILENEYSWREEEFDYVLQFLRTILLKHGASLIYTSNSIPNSLPTLVQSSLGIHSLLKRQPLKHNVIDRDKILIPPNWDSWGKIRVLREGFDVEGVSEGWGLQIQPQRKLNKAIDGANGTDAEAKTVATQASAKEDTVRAYEEIIKDPKSSGKLDDSITKNKSLEFETMSMLEFLAKQTEIMEQLKVEEESGENEGRASSKNGGIPSKPREPNSELDENNRVNEHIGPVQFNMGGIQVDAEDMLNRLKDREREETPDREATPAAVATPDGKQQNEALASFFAGLIKRGGANSPKPGPR